MDRWYIRRFAAYLTCNYYHLIPLSQSLASVHGRGGGGGGAAGMRMLSQEDEEEEDSHGRKASVHVYRCVYSLSVYGRGRRRMGARGGGYVYVLSER